LNEPTLLPHCQAPSTTIKLLLFDGNLTHKAKGIRSLHSRRKL
jgi:hypothetical protein